MRAALEDREQTEDAELTLSVGSLLGIFFGVVMICGIFFGFGYSIGRHNTSPPATASAESDSPKVTSNGRRRHAMPPPNSSPEEAANDSGTAAPAAAPDAANGNFPANYAAPVPDEASSSDKGEAAHAGSTRIVESDRLETSLKAATTPNRRAVSAAKPRPIPASPAVDEPRAAEQASRNTVTSPLMVQIAAVSRQEDAEVLSAALRKRGFSPMVRNGFADKFYHVQIGPFTDRSQAETTKNKLLADGYNAILK
jgi:cell division septation protein DedD